MDVINLADRRPSKTPPDNVPWGDVALALSDMAGLAARMSDTMRTADAPTPGLEQRRALEALRRDLAFFWEDLLNKELAKRGLEGFLTPEEAEDEDAIEAHRL